MQRKQELQPQSVRIRTSSRASSRNSNRSRMGELVMRNSGGFDENTLEQQEKQEKELQKQQLQKQINQGKQQQQHYNNQSQQSGMYDVSKLIGELGNCFETPKESDKMKLREIIQQSRELQQENREQKKEMEKAERNYQRKLKKKKDKNKDMSFLTGVVVDDKPKQQQQQQQQQQPMEQSFYVDDQDVLDNLRELDSMTINDDLAELKKMIYLTKKNISSFAGDIYSLNKQVKEISSSQQQLGYSGSVHELERVSKKLNKYLPDGDSSNLFTYNNKYDYDYTKDPLPQSTSLNQLETLRANQAIQKGLKSLGLNK